MKKIFTLIAVAFAALSVNAQTTLAEFKGTVDESKGVAISGTTAEASVKIHANQDAVNVLQLKNGYTTSELFNDNAITLTTDGGFKAGDVLTVAGFFNNSDESKKAAVSVITVDADKKCTVVWTSKAFINGKTVADDPEEETYKLEADMDKIILGRTGNTGTNLMTIKVTRAAAGGGETPAGEAAFWKASELDLTTVVKSTNSSAGLKAVATQYPGEAPAEDQIKADAAAATMTDYVFTVEKGSITLKGVSTPNSDSSDAEAWQYNTDENNFLDTDKCDPKFEGFVKPKTGNPSMECVEYFFTNGDGNRVGPRYVETFWEPGCGVLPVKGCYYELTAAAAGTLQLGVYVNKGNHATYIVEKESIAPIAAANIDVAFYYQNKTFTFADGDNTIDMVEGKLADDYIIQHTNGYSQVRPALGYMTFKVEAGKTYYVFNPMSQLGVYGFQYTPEGADAIKAVAAPRAWNANAPMYNLAGQRVDKSYKGIVIQNGRKFYNK